MKAIIIKFEGGIPNETELVSKLALTISKFASAEKVDIAVLNDKDVNEALLRLTDLPSLITISEVKENAKTTVSQLEEFCKDVIENIGATSLKTIEVHNQDLLLFLIKNKDKYQKILKFIASITPQKTVCYGILKQYDLQRVPSLLKDLNPTFKLY